MRKKLTRQESQLAMSVRLLFDDTFRYPRGDCSQKRWEILNQNPDLKSFFKACTVIGDNAWLEEHLRLRKEGIQRGKTSGFKSVGFSDYVILEQIDIWKGWGKAYREAMSIC
jgi:hypothetical protein